MAELWIEAVSSPIERTRVVSHWADSLEAACDIICRTPAEAMKSIVVTGTLLGGPEESLLLRAFCRKLADDRGLRELVSLERGAFTVSFSRAVTPSA